jgi:hypothetical protein
MRSDQGTKMDPKYQKMMPFWQYKPSEDERTHMWDVTDGSMLPKSERFVDSTVFECGGVTGLSLRFYPLSREKKAMVELHAADELELMVKCKFTVAYSDQPKWVCETDYLQNFPVRRSIKRVYAGDKLPAVRTIWVELVSVQKKSQQQDTQKINFVPGDMLRVTWTEQIAEESFGVVGCKHEMKKSMKPYLGKKGCVVRVEQCVVELRHTDNTHVRWGNGALDKLLTSEVVDGMKVPTEFIFFSTLMY